MSRLLVVFTLGLVLPSAAMALTIRVPDDASTIQEAIGATSPTRVDTILVAAGHYNERVFINRAMVLRSRSGAEVTTLDGGETGNVITVRGVDRTCIIEDLTISGGQASHPDSVGAGIYLNQNASPTIQRCRLVENHSRAGGGLAAYVDCSPLIRDCWIANNDGGGVILELGPGPRGGVPTEIYNTVIARNSGYGVYVLKGAHALLRNCTVAYNTGDGLRADQQAVVTMEKCIVSRNLAAGVIRTDNTVCFSLSCNDVFGNPGGQWVNTNPVDSCFPGRGSGDVSIEACFQNADLDNFHLQRNSPLCSLRRPGSCGVLGAYEDPCSGLGGSCVVAIEPSSWAGVKILYR
jgi:hypothetical protein